MQKIALPALFVGLALAVAVVAWQGVGDVGAALAHAGIHLLWLPPWFLISMLLAGVAWATIFPPGTRPVTRRILAATWIGMSINWLLPVAQIGGEIAKGAWLARRAEPAAMMVATALSDKILQAVTQALVAVVGMALLLAVSTDTRLAPFALGFAAAIIGLVATVLVLQRRDLLTRMTSVAERLYFRAVARRRVTRAGDPSPLVVGAASVDAGIREIFRSPRRAGVYCAIRLVSRLVIAGEVWLVLYVAGHPIGVLEALMIECLTQTVRSAAFAVPGAYGVQEGAFVLIGPLVGVPPEMALSVSLAKRMREVVIGVPGLVYLQLSEGLSSLRLA